MPTRRTMELVVITVVLMHPVMGLLRLWAVKTLGERQSGVAYGAAEAITVVS
jgi:hypothetical protein